MTSRELKIGDVFRVVGDDGAWRKTGPWTFQPVGWRPRWGAANPVFTGKELELIERVGEIGRSGDMLILRNGEVTLEFIGNWEIHSHTPDDPQTEFVLARDSFGGSSARVPTATTAIAFKVRNGAKELGRPKGSEVFAYAGRVYARATKVEALAKNAPAGRKIRVSAGGYKRTRIIDGKGRLIIVGLLTIPSEFALYDIIMEHFGPDTVPRA